MNPNVPNNFPMPFFTSHREKRFWLRALATFLAIYSTIGLNASLSNQIVASGLLDLEIITAFFFVAIFLIGDAILTPSFQIRPRGAEIGIALGIASVYFLLFLRMASPWERTHISEYSLLALFICEALSERASNGRHVPVPALLAFAVPLSACSRRSHPVLYPRPLLRSRRCGLQRPCRLYGHPRQRHAPLGASPLSPLDLNTHSHRPNSPAFIRRYSQLEYAIPMFRNGKLFNLRNKHDDCTKRAIQQNPNLDRPIGLASLHYSPAYRKKYLCRFFPASSS